MTIVLTGATGGLGSLVVQHLLHKVPASDIIASVRHPEQATALKEQGITVRYGDYDDPASLRTAFAGASKLLLISSSSLDDTQRIRQHATALEAAKHAGIEHVVYTGLAYAEKVTIRLSQVHQATEHALRTTGIPYTVLRNAFYTHGFVNSDLKAAVERGELVTSAGNGKLNTATRDNQALAAAVVLTEAGHENKTYELTATQPWSFSDLAQILSDVSGKRIIHRSLSEADFVQHLKHTGVPDNAIPFHLAIYKAIAADEFAPTSNDLHHLIGDAFTPLQESVREIL